MNQLKQKHYRDFTIGELLDAGLNVEVKKHRSNKEHCKWFANKFEGAKQSGYRLNEELSVIRAWKEKFEFLGFEREEESNA